MVDKIAYYDVIVNSISLDDYDRSLLKLILPEDIVQYAKLDLNTMKDIISRSFSLHVERDAMDTSHTYDIYANNEYECRKGADKEIMYTISVLDNENKTKKIFHKNIWRCYEIRDSNNNVSQFNCCMIKKTLDGMYVMFYGYYAAMIRYYSEESAEIIGDFENNFSLLSNPQDFGLMPDGEVYITRKFQNPSDQIEYLDDIENQYSKEVAKLQLRNQGE